MICINIWLTNDFLSFPKIVDIHAYAIFISCENITKSFVSHIFIHIIRRRILRWVRIWSRNFNLTYAFSRKMGLKKFAWAEYKNFALYELFIKFWVEICAYCMFDSCMTHNIEIIKNKPMSHNSWLEQNFWKIDPSPTR